MWQTAPFTPIPATESPDPQLAAPRDLLYTGITPPMPPPELSGLPDTCYLYAAMDISTRYKVGLILPKLDEGGALLALYHATQQFPFPLHYVQTDNGLEFQRRFHTKCTELGLEHFYIHKAPNAPKNAVVERSSNLAPCEGGLCASVQRTVDRSPAHVALSW